MKEMKATRYNLYETPTLFGFDYNKEGKVKNYKDVSMSINYMDNFQIEPFE